MSRKTTTIWAVGGGVVVVAAIAVGAHALATIPASPTSSATATASSTPSSSATPTTKSSATATTAPSASATTTPGTTATPSATATPTVQSVTPLLSTYSFSGSTLSLGAGVNGLVDTGGTCTATVSRGSVVISKSFPASAGPSSTDCGAMTITSSQFTAGAWSVTITYKSSRASGTSAPTTVNF